MIELIELIAPVAAVVATFADSWTTYRGVFVKKIASEMNPSWFTQKAWRLFVMPAIAMTEPIAAFGLAHMNPPAALWTQVVVSGIASALVYRHGTAAYKNWQINRGTK